MSRLIILFLALTISASFDQMQGDFFLRKWSFSKIEMIAPEYFSVLTKYIGAIAIIWVSYFQETEYPKQLKIAAWLMTGFGIDFLLECNQCWFDIGSYAFGYRTLAFIIFGCVIIRTIFKEKWIML